MKKKIVFCVYNLDIGGIETALVSLLNNLDMSKYEIYLFLVKKEGVFLNSISPDIKIINFDVCESKNIIYRKIVNLCKVQYFKFKYKNKFDFAAAYATSIKACTKLAHHFSKNNAIWIHGDFTQEFKNKALKKFIKFINVQKYRKIVFVSNSIKNNFTKAGIHFKGKSYVFNNFIDYNRIKKLAEENHVEKRKTTFINVSRHEEKAKNLLLLLRCVKRLINEGYNFDLWMIGDGPDHELYTDFVKNNNLENVVTFYGRKSNPFVYYKAADAVVLSSVFEGNPVAFIEAKVLGKPIITTNVSDALIDIKDRYGIVTDINDESYYNGLKQFLNNGFLPQKFNPQQFNKEILQQLEQVINKLN